MADTFSLLQPLDHNITGAGADAARDASLLSLGGWVEFVVTSGATGKVQCVVMATYNYVAQYLSISHPCLFRADATVPTLVLHGDDRLILKDAADLRKRNAAPSHERTSTANAVLSLPPSVHVEFVEPRWGNDVVGGRALGVHHPKVRQ